MLQAYFDDSGTHDKSPVVVVGGLLGDELRWESFDRMWRAKLAAPIDGKPPLRKFGLADCRSASKDFSGFTLAERDFLTHEFRQIIKVSGVIGFSAGIDKRAWDELVTPERRQNMGPAENFCLTKCVRTVLVAAANFFPDDEIEIIYDIGRKPILPARIQTFDWARALQCPRVTSFRFEKVEEFSPLQGADMIATESFWFAQKQLADNEAKPRAHFEDYIKSALGNGSFMTREIILQELERRESDGRVKDAYRF